MGSIASSDDAGERLRALPSVDALLRHAALAALPSSAVRRGARRLLDRIRADIRSGRDGDGAGMGGADIEGIARQLAETVRADCASRYPRVVNATGIVLHTGLGRAPLAETARAAVLAASGYAVVEVDVASGERNQREAAIAGLLGDLLGVSGALVVNNNAAAVNLTLRALAGGREAVVSRGELVEIGGGFRMPDVMAEAGGRMVEVGATNRTHLRDYAAAINDETGLFVKVHPSNFRILGFAGTPSLAELVGLGRERGVGVFEDLGSGLLATDVPPALSDEPRVVDSVATGADVVCFSGDKLLGGPQCGILVGDRDAIATIRAHPLYRAFRCDKLTLAALDATLRIHRDGDPLEEVPTLRAIACPAERLRDRAEQLAAAIPGRQAEVVPSESFVGSGANPARPIPSFAVALPGGARTAAALRERATVPVFARVADGRCLLDLRTLFDEDLDGLAALVAGVVDV